MKILIISTLYPPYVVGGAEKAANLLAEALARQGHSVVVASLHPEPHELFEQRNGVSIYRLPMDNVYWPFGRKNKLTALSRLVWHVRDVWNFSSARRIAKILDKERPDVVHTHCIAGFSLSVWREVKRRKIRLVHTLHDYYLLCTRSSLFKNGDNCVTRCLDCKLLTSGRAALSNLPDSVVSVSNYTLNEHIRRHCFQKTPTSVIANIASSPALQNLHADPPAGENSDLIFGYIGKLEEPKGIETVLEATTLLNRDNWRLRIAGKGVDKYVRKLLSKYPDARIEWLGFTNPAEFYSSVDVVVLPSRWGDPAPYVCVESLFAGKPLICSASGGIPEIAKLADVVEFFPPGDVSSLASIMDNALISPEKWRVNTTAQSNKLHIFRESEVLRKYLQVYDDSMTI